MPQCNADHADGGPTILGTGPLHLGFADNTSSPKALSSPSVFALRAPSSSAIPRPWAGWPSRRCIATAASEERNAAAGGWQDQPTGELDVRPLKRQIASALRTPRGKTGDQQDAAVLRVGPQAINRRIQRLANAVGVGGGRSPATAPESDWPAPSPRRVRRCRK